MWFDGPDRHADEPVISERVGPDEQHDRDALGRLRDGRHRRVAFEHGLIGASEDREDVVPMRVWILAAPKAAAPNGAPAPAAPAGAPSDVA
jgi:hypothetical protein